MERPYQGNATIEDNFSNLKVTIPARRNGAVIAFLIIWLCGWCLGEFTVLGAITGILKGSTPSPFLSVWLVGWTVGGFFAFNVLIWNLKGKEIITVETDTLTIEKKATLFFKPKSYDLNEVKNIRVDETVPDNGFLQRRNAMEAFTSTGVIRFDYGMRTVKFAGGVDAAEAKFILQKLNERHLLSEKNYQQ